MRTENKGNGKAILAIKGKRFEESIGEVNGYECDDVWEGR